MLCDFTNKYLLYFYKNKYNIDDNNYLCISLINEKKKNNKLY